MKGEPLPSEHHVARHCPKSRTDGAAVLGTAFLLREDETDGLSVNWLEHDVPDGTRPDQIAAVSAGIAATGFRLKKSARFAVLRVEATTSLSGAANSLVSPILTLGVEHDPKPPNESHSLITGLPPYADPLATQVADLLAERVTEPLYEALAPFSAIP